MPTVAEKMMIKKFEVDQTTLIIVLDEEAPIKAIELGEVIVKLLHNKATEIFCKELSEKLAKILPQVEEGKDNE